MLIESTMDLSTIINFVINLQLTKSSAVFILVVCNVRFQVNCRKRIANCPQLHYLPLVDNYCFEHKLRHKFQTINLLLSYN